LGHTVQKVTGCRGIVLTAELRRGGWVGHVVGTEV